MRHGTFLAIGALLTCLLGFLGPVPGTFNEPTPTSLAAPSADRCLALSYEPAEERSWMPSTIRLTPRPARVFDRPWSPGYHAVGGPGVGGYLFAGWRAAGADSIDIGWHHSPLMRLPARRLALGDTLVGRGGWWSYPTFYNAMLGEGDFVVHGVEIVCSRSE